MNTELLTLRDLQKDVDIWIKNIGGGYFSELTNMVLLTEEVGELARIMARIYGDQVPKKGDLNKNIAEELADVLWVTVCLANQTGVDLQQAFLDAMKKKTKRDSERFAPRRDKNPNGK